VETTFSSTGTAMRCLNILSYSHIGFAAAQGGCADAVEKSLRRYGVSTCGARLEGGPSELHATAGALITLFIGQEVRSHFFNGFCD